MFNIRWSKLPKNRQYNYHPRYWDQKKEDLDSRIKNVDLSKAGDKNAMQARIRSGMRRGYVKDDSFRKKSVFRTNMTLFAVIILLIIATYYGLTVYLPKMLDAFNLK